MRWGIEVRSVAAAFYEQANADQKAAGQLLTTHLKGVGPSNPGRYCKAQWERLRLHGSLEDAPRSGRPRKVPKRLASRIGSGILREGGADEEPLYYENVQDFLDQKPQLNEEVQELRCHPRTLERAVHAEMPDLVTRKVKVNKKLSSEQKRARKKFAAWMRRLTKAELQAMVFVDESSFDLKREGSRAALVKKGRKLRPRTSEHAVKRSKWRIHYLGAVMHGVGHVGFFPVTGTEGLGKLYMVIILFQQF